MRDSLRQEESESALQTIYYTYLAVAKPLPEANEGESFLATVKHRSAVHLCGGERGCWKAEIVAGGLALEGLEADRYRESHDDIS